MAQNKSLSLSDALMFGWGVVEKNFGLILQFILATLVVFFATYLFGRIVGPKTLFANLVNWFANAVIVLGWVWAALKFHDGKKPRLEDLQAVISPIFVNYLLASILFGLAVGVGFLLLVIPGLYLLATYGLFTYLIVDKKMGSLEALKASAKVTDGAKMELFVFGILAVLINVLGALVFGVGLLVTIPVTTLAGAFVYRKLLSQTKL